MLKIVWIDRRSCPMFVCDICGDAITEYHAGAAVFDNFGEELSKREVLHAHKGQCHDQAEKQIGPRSGWQELGAHLYMACKNAGVDLEAFTRLSEQDDRMGSIGL